MNKLKHIPVLLEPFLSMAPSLEKGSYLDVTAGGGGHLSEFIKRHPAWRVEAWDRDPLARARVLKRLEELGLSQTQFHFKQQCFSNRKGSELYDYIFADLGVSSFQLDDPSRGMSFFSDSEIDFRMNPEEGLSFKEWFRAQSEERLEEIISLYGEEKKSRLIAREMKSWPMEDLYSAKEWAQKIAIRFPYKGESKRHPATRIFQAFRIAINGEMTELRELLAWAPKALKTGARLAVISFHSLEDRFVKKQFNILAKSGEYKLLTPKPTLPTELEESSNPRSRSAKMRVVERVV